MCNSWDDMPTDNEGIGLDGGLIPPSDSWSSMSVDNESPEDNPLSPFNSELPELSFELENQNSEDFYGSGNGNFRNVKLQKPSTGRIVGMVVVGMIVSFFIFLIVTAVYTRFIRFPDEQERVWEQSRLYALENFCSDVNKLDVDIEDSYLIRELPYANGNSDREEFMKYVVRSVGYTTDIVNKKNVYGNDFVDKNTLEIVTENSWLQEDEEATIHFIDYESISFDQGMVGELVKDSGISSDDIRYRDKLTDMFCQYIYSIDPEELPLEDVRHVPNMVQTETGFEVTLAEDIYIDELLFSSDALYKCFERFADAVAKNIGLELEISDAYTEWGKLSSSKREEIRMPLKYGKYSISHIWCGAYYLIEEYSSEEDDAFVKPQLGDGSKEDPASVGTPVITYIIRTNADGSEDKLPIRVTMKEFGVSQDAIDWFETKDVQNRGYNITSEVQYCYYVFEVTNLSKETLTVYDNTAVCDSGANSSGRTGTVYGLQNSVTLEPEESGIIESWNRSTELNHKYVIWGNDFARREQPVWFRVLAGDLEDPSEDKGVYLNTTREDQ